MAAAVAEQRRGRPLIGVQRGEAVQQVEALGPPGDDLLLAGQQAAAQDEVVLGDDVHLGSISVDQNGLTVLSIGGHIAWA